MAEAEFLSTSEVARLVGVSGDTVRYWARNGLLPAVQSAGGIRLYRRRDVEKIKHERSKRERKPRAS
jgi:excisionase family DNA binding protein